MVGWLKAWVIGHPIAAAIAGVSAVVVAGMIGVGVVALVSSTDPDSVSDTARSSRSEAVEITPACLVGGGLDVFLPADATPNATTGTLELRTIAGVRLSGTYSCDRSSDWSISIDDGAGRLGDVELDSFTGTITSVAGLVSSDVRASMDGLSPIVPAWEQSAVVGFPYASGALGAEVLVATRRGNSSVWLTGPARDDGTFALAGTGSVRFAATDITVSGNYSSVGFDGASASEWNLSGAGVDGSVDGVSVLRPTISMTSAAPGVTGTAVVALMQGGIALDTQLSFVDETDWTLEANGAAAEVWQPQMIPGLTVRSGEMTGTITNSVDDVEWDLRTSLSMVDEKLQMTGEFRVEGPERWIMGIERGEGSILGASSDVDFDRVVGRVTIDAGAVSGTVDVEANGELLADLPDGWIPKTNLVITFAKTPGGVVAISKNVVYAMTNRTSRLLLHGDFQSSDAFKLTAGGSLYLSGSSIPFGGVYESAGYVVDGIPRDEPYWRMSGNFADAEGGGVALAGGAAMNGGSIGIGNGSARARQPILFEEPLIVQMMSVTATSSTSFSGTTDVAISPTSSFTVGATVAYTDEDNWLLDVAATEGDPWTPFSGLTIQTDSFHGTVTSVEAEETWDLSIDEVEWKNITTGVDLLSGFTLTDTCPLSENCIDADGLYVGFSGSPLTFPGDVPDMTADGAFITDATWARFDARAGSLTYGGITLSDTDLAMWFGERSDQFDPELEMPDLSTGNNGFNIEFCGDFRIEIPDISTVTSGGCLEWSPDGGVIAQAATSDDFTSGSSNGVKIGSSGVDGFAWTNLESEPTVTIGDVDLELTDGRSYLTGHLNVLSDLMKATGNPDADATVDATGWFSNEGDFSLDGFIPVNMSNSGFELESVSIHIGKEGHDFSLSLGAEATVSISGNHYPVSAYIGLDHASGSNEIVVSLTATGATNLQPQGSFDDPTLLPTGNFEPDSPSLVEGSFDQRPPAGFLDDGGFESSGTTKNLLTNPDFETGITNELMPNSDFESGSSGNLLPNSDFEDNNVLVNGDFETGNISGWRLDSGYTSTMSGDSNSPVSAPSQEQGWTVSTLRNTRSSGTSTNLGLSQDFSWAPQSGASYTLWAWVKSPDTSSGRIGLYVNQTGTAAGCSAQTNVVNIQTFDVSTSWTLVSVSATGLSCRTGWTITVDPLDAGDSVMVDAMTFVVNSSPGALDLPNTTRATAVASFDSLPPITRASDVNLSSDFGNALRSDGNGSWWFFNPDSYGYANGDFDVSVNIYFANSSARDIATFGFWMNGTGSTASGYGWRAQSSSNDGGFWQINSNGTQTKLAASQYAWYRSRWYTLHLSAVGSTVSAEVIDTTNGSTVQSQTYTLPAGGLPRSGVFGQPVDGAGSSEGHRWDNFVVNSGSAGQVVRNDPGNAHGGNRYMAMMGSAEYSTLEAPAVGTVYSYSAWVRSRGATVSGTMKIETVGGSFEQVVVPFTATSSWTKVTASLRIANGGHTDVKPRLVDLSPSNVEVDVDDTSFSMSPWAVTPDSPGLVSSTISPDAHGGVAALEFTDRNNGSSVFYDVPGWPGVGTTYTLTAWMKSSSSVGAALRLRAIGGTEESSTTSMTTQSGWTQYTTVLTTNGYGHTNLRVQVDINAGNQYRSVLIDDVSLTAVNFASDMYGSVSIAPEPTTWSNHGSAVKVVNEPGSAHGGLGMLCITPTSGSTRSTSVSVSATPKTGSTYTATAWVRGPVGDVAGRILLSTGLESTSASFTANGSWQLVTATLPVTKSGATTFTMTIENNNTGGRWMWADDVGVQLVGGATSDAWISYSDSGYLSTAVISDAAKAHAGSNYLELKANNGNGYIYLDTQYTSTAGHQYTMSAWVRSPSGQTISGRLYLQSYGGSGAGSDRTESFTVSGSEWKQVFVTVPLAASGNSNVRSHLIVDTVGVALDVDDVTSGEVATWSPLEHTNSTINETVIDDSSRAADGSSYMQIDMTGTNGGGIINTTAANIKAGTKYSLTAYVRSTTGSFVDGQFGLAFGIPTTEAWYQYYTAGSDWQPVTMTFTTTKDANYIQSVFDIYGSSSRRSLDVDSIVLTAVTSPLDSAWDVRTDINPTTKAILRDDATLAHDGSYGSLELSKTGSNDATINYDIDEVPAAGSIYSGNVWVRSASGKPASGRYDLWATDNSWVAPELASVEFTATGEWQLLSVRLAVSGSNHRFIRSEMVLYTPDVTLSIDDMEVQKMGWTAFSDGGSSAQTIVTDGERAQSGNGYLRITNSNASSAGAFVDTSNLVPVGTTQTLRAWVRSTSGAPVRGKIELLAGQWGGAEFTAGADWTQVSVTVPVVGSGSSGLRFQLRNNTMNSGLDVDSVTVSDESTPVPDGINTPLAHPETGYAYLWDDAFGIPGAHLWALSAQIQYMNGAPGLGVGATIYLDPTKATGLLTGTDWLKGDMALNVSRADPCFSFGFDGTGTNTKVQIDGGVFATSKFQMNFAPKGCTIGETGGEPAYVVPAGATIALDTALGDTGIHLDIEIGRDDNNLPTFYFDTAVNNAKIGGFIFNTMQLTADISADHADIAYVGDFSTPMGNFYGDFDLSVNADKLHMAGDISVTDWQLVGGTFDVSALNYSMAMDIPFGSGVCGSYSSSISGQMSMGSKKYAFTGSIGMNCGNLSQLHLAFGYYHGGISYQFGIDYNSKTKMLAGGINFNFERSTSWKFLGHKYNRHPKMAIALAFSMNTSNPSSASLALGGTVSVSGGSGTIECAFGGSSDDQCSISVRINSFGGHSYSDTW